MVKYPQIATYWGPDFINEFNEADYSTPLTYQVRWENNSILTTDLAGKEFISRAHVYSQVDFILDGYLFLGTSIESKPKNQYGAFAIRKIDVIPSLKGSKQTKRYWLGV